MHDPSSTHDAEGFLRLATSEQQIPVAVHMPAASVKHVLSGTPEGQPPREWLRTDQPIRPSERKDSSLLQEAYRQLSRTAAVVAADDRLRGVPSVTDLTEAMQVVRRLAPDQEDLF